MCLPKRLKAGTAGPTDATSPLLPMQYSVASQQHDHSIRLSGSRKTHPRQSSDTMLQQPRQDTKIWETEIMFATSHS